MAKHGTAAEIAGSEAGTVATCPSCGDPASRLYRVGDLNRAVSEQQFQYFRCGRCRYVFLRPVPEDLAFYYPSDYHALPVDTRDIATAAALERYKIEMVTSLVPAGNLVEVGPGRGNFCYLAREAGFRVSAIEQSEACRAFLLRALDVPAYATLEAFLAQPAERMPDVIAMWHVIEHLDDPWGFLQRAVACLRPGGIIVVATPNPESLQFRLFGRRWAHLDAPRHTNLVPMALLDHKLAQAGLRQRLLTTLDEGSLGWNGFGWAFSCANFFRARTARRAARLIGRILGTLATPFDRAENAGAAYTAIYQKPAHEVFRSSSHA